MFPFMTRDTVIAETPAARATSKTVGPLELRLVRLAAIVRFPVKQKSSAAAGPNQ
jgi:hypothetical protein